MSEYFLHNRRQENRLKKALSRDKWSSVKRVMDNTGLSDTTTREVLERLYARGKIYKKVVSGDTNQRIFYYSLP
jgi:beta-xylosidase